MGCVPALTCVRGAEGIIISRPPNRLVPARVLAASVWTRQNELLANGVVDVGTSRLVKKQ